MFYTFICSVFVNVKVTTMNTGDSHGCYMYQILMSVKREQTTVTPMLHVPTLRVLTTVHVMMDIPEMDEPVVNIRDETSGLQHINMCET